MFLGNRWVPTELGETLFVVWICIILIIMGALLWFGQPTSSSKNSHEKQQKINKRKCVLRKKEK